MKTSINGVSTKWTEAIWRKWIKVKSGPNMPEGEVTHCNYFTPKPWRNEYDRGRSEEGFVYTIQHRHVWTVNINT